MTGIELLRGIQPETGDALSNPVLHDSFDFPTECIAAPVQIRHIRAELRLVPPIGPVQLLIAILLLTGEEIIVNIGAFCSIRLRTLREIFQILRGSLEPFMVGTAVVYDKIDDDLDPPLFTFSQKGLEVLQGTVGRIDLIVIADIILVIAAAGMNGHEPNAVNAKLLQIVQLRANAIDIADAVAVGITEGINENFVPSTVIIVRALP